MEKTTRQQKELERKNAWYDESEIIGDFGYWEYNLKTGEFWGSQGAKRLYGFPPDKEYLTTEEVESCIPERERVHKALVDLIEKDKQYDLEFLILPCDDSQPRIIRSKAAVTRAADGKPKKVSGVIQDITLQKETEEKLRFSEERLQLALDGSRDGLWDWDLITGEVYYSDRFYKMLGYEREDFPNTYSFCFGLLHPEDDKEARRKVDEHLEGKTEFYESTFRLKCKEGYYRWITSRGSVLRKRDGKPYRFLGFHTDITNRKNAERAYLRSEEKFRRLFEGIADGALLLNEEGSIVEANPAALTMLGLSLQQLKSNFSTASSGILFKSNNEKFTLEENPVVKTLRTGSAVKGTKMGVASTYWKRLIWFSVDTIPIFEGLNHLPVNVFAIFREIEK